MSASEHRLYFLLQLVAHRLKKRADGALKVSAGLTTAQAAALSIIAKDGPVTQRFVADKLSQRESAVMTMASRLLAADYISRKRSPSDGRAWELAITQKGLAALSDIKAPFGKINAVLDKNIDAQDAERLAIGLKNILAALDE
ncbi:MarR family winged helix-turn-helix transcriptional regulator [Parasphingorhabdus cellanae]|uniref:MarR family transcriptional regulator n=1 Tax=Parasphingorhabdus cellanae TaxID=2806553 RepID=A0ABX7T375_9SPHN|nr:MarR family transcriptional regulator [Parasphingorhabdus cellanae]QTD54705.1 MarR family transcriptional regulator [Parasphingorhabdus cellanae]